MKPAKRPSFRWNTFADANRGLQQVFTSQANFRVQCGCATLAITLGWLLGLAPLEWVAVIVCCAMVLSAECFNTALEMLSDHRQPEFDARIGLVKDVAAAGVWLSAIGAFLVGLLIYLPKLIALFKVAS